VYQETPGKWDKIKKKSTDYAVNSRYDHVLQR